MINKEYYKGRTLIKVIMLDAAKIKLASQVCVTHFTCKPD